MTLYFGKNDFVPTVNTPGFSEKGRRAGLSSMEAGQGMLVDESASRQDANHHQCVLITAGQLPANQDVSQADEERVGAHPATVS